MQQYRYITRLTDLRLIVMAAAFMMSVAYASAQNDVQFTQYWAVPSYYNPGATGEIDFVRIRAGARLQWLGIENAPKSFLVSGDTPLKIGKKRIGVGVNMTQESIGLFSNMLINAQASYKLKLFKGTLSIGVQGGYYNSKFKGSEVYLPDGDDFHQSTDEAIPTQDVAGNAFDLSAGIWYNHKHFYLGVSGLHLLEPTVRLDTEGTETASETSQFETVLKRALYFTAGGNIPIKNTLFEMHPSMMLKTDFSDFTAEVTLRASYKRFMYFGVGYRYNDAVSAMVAAEFKNFFLGYSYDYPTSAISRASSGSHELILGYQVKLDFSGKNKNKHRSIRIM